MGKREELAKLQSQRGAINLSGVNNPNIIDMFIGEDNSENEILLEDADKFEPYPNEKIRLRLHTGEKRNQLKESIIKNGILIPVIAMPSEHRGKLIIISGQNRWDIATELSIPIPYQLKNNLTQEQADSICIDTNLLNRQFSELSFSELGWMLRTKAEIMNHQGNRSDLETLVHNEPKLNTVQKIGKEYKLSESNVKRYIRLTYLTDELLKLVDDNKLNFITGVSISFLKQNEMQLLYEYIITNNYKITPKIAEELKKLSQSTIDNIDIENILNGLNKPEDKKLYKISNSTIKKIADIIPSEDKNRINEIIIMALNQYYKA